MISAHPHSDRDLSAQAVPLHRHLARHRDRSGALSPYSIVLRCRRHEARVQASFLCACDSPWREWQDPHRGDPRGRRTRSLVPRDDTSGWPALWAMVMARQGSSTSLRMTAGWEARKECSAARASPARKPSPEHYQPVSPGKFGIPTPAQTNIPLPVSRKRDCRRDRLQRAWLNDSAQGPCPRYLFVFRFPRFSPFARCFFDSLLAPLRSFFFSAFALFFAAECLPRLLSL